MTEIATKYVEKDWKWFEDYGFVYAEWTVNCPADRTCQVGMGINAFGEPRGEKIRFSGYQEFTTIGIGSIHIRVVDGQESCKVRLDRGKVGLIPIYDGPFPN